MRESLVFIFFSFVGAQQKHAVVQWFTHITEVPKNKQKLLKRRISSQEVFFDLVSGYDTDIAVETIIESVLVRTAAYLHAEGKKKQTIWKTEQCSCFTSS